MPDLPISLLNPLAVPLTGDVSAIVNAGSTQKFTNDVLATCFNNNYFLSQDPHFKIIASNFTIQKTGIITTLIGGQGNRVSSSLGAVVGGAGALNNSVYSIIGGGANNLIELGAGSDPQASFLGAGTANAIYFGQDSFLGAGIYNYTSGDYSVICGGNSNSGRSYGASVVGGKENWIQRSADFGFIGGGSGNIINNNAKYSVINGGAANTVLGNWSIVGGGRLNVISSSNHTVIGGGYSNNITNGLYTNIGGGYGNSINVGLYSSIGGGLSNSIINGTYSCILGGTANVINDNCNYSFIIGSNAVINHYGSVVLADSTTRPKASHAIDSLALCFAGGVVVSGGKLLLDSGVAVANNATDPGQIGEIFFSGVYFYVCTGINPGNGKTWGRLKLAEW